MSGVWRRLSGENIECIHATISNDVMANLEHDLEIYVGADSQRFEDHVNYVTAIVVYRNVKGGLGYYLSEKEKLVGKLDNRTRLWNETAKAVDKAQWLNELLREFDLRVSEVHADLNNDKKHFSNTVVQMCLGFICSMGFNGKIKPEAWAASSVANSKTK